MGRPKDIRLLFNAAAEIYDEIRPSYPAELFDVLFQLLPAEPDVVEVGPGTGQATKDLLARGARVHAIEIGSAMATPPPCDRDRSPVSPGQGWGGRTRTYIGNGRLRANRPFKPSCLVLATCPPRRIYGFRRPTGDAAR